MPSYAFMSGKIRALETKLPDMIDLERMIDAPSFDDAYKVLNDTHYSDKLLDIAPHEFEILLKKDMSELKELFVKYLPSKKLAQLLFLKDDWNNIKVLLKAKYSNQEVNQNKLSSNGNIAITVLTDYIIAEAKMQKMNDSFKKRINHVMHTLDSDFSAENVDLLCDQAYFSQLWDKSKIVKETFIKDYVQLLIDRANARLVFRALAFGKNDSFTQSMISENGKVSAKELRNCLKENNFDRAIELFRLKMPHLATQSLMIFAEQRSLKKLERSLDIWMETLMAQAQYKVLGPEVIIEYFQRKINSITNIRMVLVSKLNEMPSFKIRNRLLMPF